MEKIEIKNTKYQKVFDSILQKRPDITRNFLKITLRKKDIRVNDVKIHENIDVVPNDMITLYIKERELPTIEIVYKDDNIIIANKPQGMEVTKADKVYFNKPCLEDCIPNYWACHRIDMNTGGLVIMAKNQKIFNDMCECIKNHLIKKYYMTVVSGKVKAKDNLVDYIEKCSDYVKVYPTNIGNSKIAKTNYRTIKTVDELSLLDVELLTGRTHQIRAQLASHGIYIVGDEKYGDKDINKLYHTKKQQLYAYKIIFDSMPKPYNYLNGKVVEIKPQLLIN